MWSGIRTRVLNGEVVYGMMVRQGRDPREEAARQDIGRLLVRDLALLGHLVPRFGAAEGSDDDDPALRERRADRFEVAT